MKRTILPVILLFAATAAFTQWVPVPIGASSSPVTSMFAYVDTVMAGTAGDGLFKSFNQGSTWINISGNIGSTSINDIRGGVASTVLWAATENGAFYTLDHINYVNCTSSGINNMDINYFWFGDGSETAEWAIGTNGGGVYTSPDITGPWTYSSNGLSGNGLFINDISGYGDDEVDYSALATNNGVYFSFDSLTNWASNNTGLSGDQLIVKRLACLGTAVIIATHGGCYYSIDYGDSWTPLFPDEKFNTMLVMPTTTGLTFIVAGETGYYSPNFLDFYAIDFTGLNGEVISLAVTSTHLFAGTDAAGKNGKSGSVYKIPVSQLITDIPDYSVTEKNNATLEQNYPNPFSNNTVVSYTVERDSYISLVIYDFSGREVRTMVNEYQTKGSYSVRFEPGNLSPGVYTYILQADGSAPEIKKMILLQ